MKSTIFKTTFAALALLTMTSCNDKASSGNISEEGTQTFDQRPHQNEGSASGNVDTISSPGSNANDIKAASGDPNMQGQSDTHGNNVQSGDNGTGNTAAPATNR